MCVHDCQDSKDSSAVYFIDPAAGASVSGGPVPILLQPPPAQFQGQTSRLAVLPIVGDSHGCGPTPPAAVTNVIIIPPSNS